MECMETGADVNDEEADVQSNEPVDYIFDEDNGDCVEDEDNIHSDSNDEECSTAIALPPFSGYGNGYPLMGAECLTGVYVVKRFNLGIILGPHNRNRKKEFSKL